jgi:hypothetical protein
MKYFIIDALGPFVDPHNPPFNWSKVPFSQYEKEGADMDFERVRQRFAVFIEKIASIGYTAISLDDLPHMVELGWYSRETKEKLAKFRSLYEDLVIQAREHNIDVFVNFDIMYFNEEIKAYTKGRHQKILRLSKSPFNTYFHTMMCPELLPALRE